MADKIKKLLAKLPPKQLQLIRGAVATMLAGRFNELDIKALKGHKGLYRVRVGNYRIIFRHEANGEPNILAIQRRNERTYKDL